MRKRKRIQKQVLEERRRKRIREQMRMQKVLDGLKCHLSVKDIHRKTGMSEKNIRKIMESNPEEVTFLLLKRQSKIGREET